MSGGAALFTLRGAAGIVVTTGLGGTLRDGTVVGMGAGGGNFQLGGAM